MYMYMYVYVYIYIYIYRYIPNQCINYMFTYNA